MSNGNDLPHQELSIKDSTLMQQLGLAKLIEQLPEEQKQAVIRVFKRVHGDGYWHRFPRCYLLIMSPLEAVTFSWLINIASMSNGKNGWFKCRMDRMQKDLFMYPRKQNRVLDSLKRKKLIKTKLKGTPPKRLIWIDYIRVIALTDLAYEKWEKSRSTG